MVRKRTAYSIVELVIILIFLGILVAIAVPRMNFSVVSKQKADTLARKIVTDFRRTRALAISDAANNTDGFALNMTGGSPYTGYEIEDLSTSTIITNGTFSIDSAISCTGGANFQFGPLGNLKTGSDTELTVELTVAPGGRSFTITVISATGMVKCVEN